MRSRVLVVGLLALVLVAAMSPAAMAVEHMPVAADITQLIGLVSDVIAIFLEPPLLWFVLLGLVAAGIGIVKRLIPRKRAR